MPSVYRDTNALAFDPSREESGANANHVAKRNKVDKGKEVSFDDADRKAYLGGFRKRKLQRRKDALQRMEKKCKETHLVERSERRQQFKDSLGLPHNYGVENSSDDDDDNRHKKKTLENAPRDAVKVYDFGDVTTTVTTVKLNSDDEDMGGDSADDDSDGDIDTVLPASQTAPSTTKRQHSTKQPSKGGGKVDMKKMAILKAKIEGKKIKKKKQGGKSEGKKSEGKGKKGKGKGKKGKR